MSLRRRDIKDQAGEILQWLDAQHPGRARNRPTSSSKEIAALNQRQVLELARYRLRHLPAGLVETAIQFAEMRLLLKVHRLL